MKTIFIKNSKNIKKSELIEMSKDEQKNLQGGGSIVLVTDENGNTRWVFLK